jgi:hypothetical protein
MSDTVSEEFATMRAELEAELAEAWEKVEEARVQLGEAREAFTAVSIKQQALDQAAAPLGRTIASALHARLRRGDGEIRRAEGAVARAAGVVANAKAVADDLEIALAQIAQLTAPPEPAEDPVEVAA